MATTMGARAYSFLLSEAPGTLSREAVTIASGENLSAGAVLGRVTKRAASAAIPTNAGTGSGAMTALTFGPSVQVGNYVIELLATSATAAFSVTAPDGTALPNGAVGTAYTSDHLSFSIANGGTMTDGDTYTVAVTAGGTPTLVGTGTGVVSGISLGKYAQHGAYTVRLLATSGTAALDVIAPDGSALKQGAVASAYASDHINFTLSNAGTMTAGDYFVLIVAGYTAPEAKAWNPVAVDGTQEAWGILTAACDASSAATDAVAIVRNAEVASSQLAWGAAVTDAQKTTAYRQLSAAGIEMRT